MPKRTGSRPHASTPRKTLDPEVLNLINWHARLRDKIQGLEDSVWALEQDLIISRRYMNDIGQKVVHADAEHRRQISRDVRSWNSWWKSWGSELLWSLQCHRRKRSSWHDFVHCRNGSCHSCGRRNQGLWDAEEGPWSV